MRCHAGDNIFVVWSVRDRSSDERKKRRRAPVLDAQGSDDPLVLGKVCLGRQVERGDRVNLTAHAGFAEFGDGELLDYRFVLRQNGSNVVGDGMISAIQRLEIVQQLVKVRVLAKNIISKRSLTPIENAYIESTEFKVDDTDNTDLP